MEIFVTKSATKQLLRTPYKIRQKIEKEVESLAQNPLSRKSIKLSDRPGYRLKIGDYRILYSVDKKRKVVVIFSAQHRKDAYGL